MSRPSATESYGQPLFSCHRPKQIGLLLAAWALLTIAMPLTTYASQTASWPAWQRFAEHYISEGGRVIDSATPRQVTTSEGQSYALFFSLVANDKKCFDRILSWTENNLASGDLTNRLPAWQWGKIDEDTWGVLDENSASDADLWIAYTLTEAGRLWQETRYSALAELISNRILREETDTLPALGLTLLPGPHGFHPQADQWRLNPSYIPLQLVRRLATLYPSSKWPLLLTSANALLLHSAPHGFAPDWVIYQKDAGFQTDLANQGEGSFNAIRVYLWAGMLSKNDPLRQQLLKTMRPMASYVADQGTPPLSVKTHEGTLSGCGPAGFSAALLPFLDACNLPYAVHQQTLRLHAMAPFNRTDNYYDQVLSLFGTGWIEHRFRFTKSGTLTLKWKTAGQ
ncbi:MAG: cellulose synthase complex periplasmic endoglucanase BcsZ [Desulfobulbaceae bacterium]|nr:cellulose synthase complex periplasmic endoglucanase BcsZ [Desulfobulbaceae bacterium]